jgi:5-methylcytosine-specific restriction endonuclease McrA
VSRVDTRNPVGVELASRNMRAKKKDRSVLRPVAASPGLPSPTLMPSSLPASAQANHSKMNCTEARPIEKKTYSDKLKDPRWQKLRLEIMEGAGWKCEDCGDKTENLQVHHCVYVRGWEPWEYNKNTLICVCDTCHKDRQSIEELHKYLTGRLLRFSKPHQIEKWCDRLHSIIEKIPSGYRELQ